MDTLASLKYTNISNRHIDCFQATAGVPFKQGTVTADDSLVLEKADGTVLPVQRTVTSTYPDQTARWIVFDFELPVDPNETGMLAVKKSGEPGCDSSLCVSENDSEITVTNACFSITFMKDRFELVSSLKANGKDMVVPGSDIVVENENGKKFYASLANAVNTEIIASGREKVVVQLSGRHTAEDDDEFLSFRCRYTIRPHDSCLKLAYKFTNIEEPERGVMINGIWIQVSSAIGDRTTKWIRQCTHGMEWHPRPVEIKENVELICAEAFNEAAKKVYGPSADGKVVIRNLDSLREKLDEYPYFLRPGNPRTDMSGGLRQTYPYLAMNGKNGSLLGWFSEMGLHFPKRLKAERNLMIFDVWPAASGPFKLRRGMSKEHEIFLSFSDQERSFDQLESIYFDHEVVNKGVYAAPVSPVHFTVDAEHARACQVLDIDRWLPFDMDRYMKVETKLNTAGSAHSGSNVGRAGVVKGMLDVGDHMMRECWHNNEDDAILKMLREYLRCGSWFTFYSALLKAKHNAHVDFIAYDPNPLRQGTMPAHPPAHTDGAAYPSHMWVGGLLAAYEMTGEPDFLEVALAVGENMKRFQNMWPSVFYADSRECGWPMIAFIQLYHYTHDPSWLDNCEEIFQFYRDKMNDNGQILYELPHGVGTFLQGYGEFATWRACFAYWEAVKRDDVKEFLVRCLSLEDIYRVTPERLALGGWGCNDLFPAWAAYKLTGDKRFLEDNYPIFEVMMSAPHGFQWGGVDVHYFLNELHQMGELDKFQ